MSGVDEWSEVIRIVYYILDKTNDKNPEITGWRNFRVKSRVTSGLPVNSILGKELNKRMVLQRKGQSYKHLHSLRRRAAQEISIAVGVPGKVVKCSPWLSWRSVGWP